MANKGMIMLHIFAYLFAYLVILADNLNLAISPTQSLKDAWTKRLYISTICSLVIYSVANLILGLIVNKMVTKILNADIPDSETIAFALM